MKWKQNFPKPIRCNNNNKKNICMREIYSNRGLPQEIRKISNKQSNLPLKRINSFKDFLGGKVVENPPANAGDTV